MTTSLALIIEDNPEIANMFATLLKTIEFEAEVIFDGAVALERLAVISPDLVVLDLHLPSVSGQDILAQIQANERLAQTKVIVTTADAFLADRLQKQAYHVLLKPTSIHQFRELAARLRP
ncbi:MAG: response regulator [Chloroflexota bacterium]